MCILLQYQGDSESCSPRPPRLTLTISFLSFTIGGVNASLYVGEMIYEPICAVASPGQYWSLPIGGIKGEAGLRS